MENQIPTGWYYLIKHKCDLVFLFAYLFEISFLMIRTFNVINVYISDIYEFPTHNMVLLYL